jgi:hypothetical protein
VGAGVVQLPADELLARRVQCAASYPV